jgi:hypothetical protein
MIKVIDEVLNDVFEAIDFCSGYAVDSPISTRVYNKALDVVWKSDVGVLLQDVVTENMWEQL